MTRSSIDDPATRVTLTERQQEVLRLMADGLTNAEIAQRLDLSLDGVKWHVREVLARLNVDSREEAVRVWRAERRPSRRLSLLGAGILASKPLQWAGATAVVGLLGVGGLVTYAGVSGGGEPSTAEVAATATATSTPTPTPTPTPDLSSKDGITMTVVGAELLPPSSGADVRPARIAIDVVLEGRPELGRLGSPPIDPVHPEAAMLVDEDGNSYQRIGLQGHVDDDPRRVVLWFEPVPDTATTLTLTVGKAHFVSPQPETTTGERPPDATATLDGPWTVTIPNPP